MENPLRCNASTTEQWKNSEYLVLLSVKLSLSSSTRNFALSYTGHPFNSNGQLHAWD